MWILWQIIFSSSTFKETFLLISHSQRMIVKVNFVIFANQNTYLPFGFTMAFLVIARFDIHDIMNIKEIFVVNWHTGVIDFLNFGSYIYVADISSATTYNFYVDPKMLFWIYIFVSGTLYRLVTLSPETLYLLSHSISWVILSPESLYLLGEFSSWQG